MILNCSCTRFDDVRKANASHKDIEEIIEEQPSLVKVAATIIRSTDTEAQAETLIRALSTNPKKAPKVAMALHRACVDSYKGGRDVRGFLQETVLTAALKFTEHLDELSSVDSRENTPSKRRRLTETMPTSSEQLPPRSPTLPDIEENFFEDSMANATYMPSDIEHSEDSDEDKLIPPRRSKRKPKPTSSKQLPPKSPTSSDIEENLFEDSMAHSAYMPSDTEHSEDSDVMVIETPCKRKRCNASKHWA